MTKFYSKITRGFYDSALHGDNIPSDAVALTDEEYNGLFAGLSSGYYIMPGEDGRPYLQAFEQPSEEELLLRWRKNTEVSRFQARAALLQAGLLDDIEAYMADPATDPFVRIAWQDAQVFKRQSPTVLSLQPLLGLTDEQLDDLFRFAATIEA